MEESCHLRTLAVTPGQCHLVSLYLSVMFREVAIIGYPILENDRAFFIELSHIVAETSGREDLLLNSSDRLPHLTLAMLSVEESQLNELIQAVNASSILIDVVCATETRPYAPNTSPEPTDATFVVQWLTVQESSVLKSAHERAMDWRKRFHTPIKAEKKCGWIDVFDAHAFSNFQPHFTIGYGRIVQCTSRSVQLRVRVAELGERCTVRRILNA